MYRCIAYHCLGEIDPRTYIVVELLLQPVTIDPVDSHSIPLFICHTDYIMSKAIYLAVIS